MNSKQQEAYAGQQQPAPFNPNDPSLAPPPSYEELVGSAGPAGQSSSFPMDDMPTEVTREGGVSFNLEGVDPQTNLHHVKIKQTKNGTVSCDPVLNQNPDALMNYFISNCTKPSMKIKVVGYHYETRYRTVRDADGNTRTESYQQYVEDFNTSYDVSDLIQESGTIYSTPDPKNGHEHWTVPQLMERYVASTNKFKSMKLSKFPIWEYSELETMIRGAIRLTGYSGNIDVTFPMKNYKVKVESDSKIGRAANNVVLRGFCLISCLWIFALPVYCLAREKMDGCLRADFLMRMSARDWFMQNYWSIVANARGPTFIRYITYEHRPAPPRGVSVNLRF